MRQYIPNNNRSRPSGPLTVLHDAEEKKARYQGAPSRQTCRNALFRLSFRELTRDFPRESHKARRFEARAMAKRTYIQLTKGDDNEA